MTPLALIRAETRKLTTTKLPWAFLAVLVVIAGLDAAIVAFGTDMGGSKAFIATATDQQSLMAFAFNAMLGTAMFGAVAAAREYGHTTVVPTFLTTPRRHRAVVAQLTAVAAAGAILALVGQALVVTGVAIALRTTDYGFLVPTGDVAQLLATTTMAGAVGAVLGAGLGSVIRNVGGAVIAVVLVLFVVPPMTAQLLTGAGPWTPTNLFAVISGASTDVALWAALLAIAAWALIPAGAGMLAVDRRDVV